jgi:cytochrome oxidase Cu insertion factor (SCO1/SenC/PrrC family)
MPGMNSGLNSNNATIVAAFRSALLHQGIIVLFVFALLAVAWVAVREWMPVTRAAVRGAAGAAEPAWRHVLRIGFGVVWIFDGLLQAQPAMAAGLPSQVIEPTAASSPPWVQHMVNLAGTTWSYHPIQAGASAVWIQIGIGAWLIAAPRGPWSRLAGLASVAWGLVVWVFGESFGGIFAPGLTLLFGAPGAVLFYCAAGALIALPDRYWRTPQVGRTVLAVLGVFFAGMAVLQAWPGRGFWQGTLHGHQGALTSMIHSMAQTPQPSVVARWVASFASFTAAHGFAVNLVAVIAMALIGAGLLAAARTGQLPGQDDQASAPPRWALVRGRPWPVQLTMIVLIVFCLADWVLIEDFGFFGGLGTDPNSMIPLLLVSVAGYLALAPAAEGALAPAPGRASSPLPATAPQPVTSPQPAIPPQPAASAASATPAVSAAATPPAATPPAATPPAATPPAATQAAAAASVAAPGPPERPAVADWRSWLHPARLARAFSTASTRAVLAIWAVAIIIIGAAPMAAAQASRNADPVIAQAIDGNSAPLNFPAAPFRLTDQYGREVSLASLRGKVVLLTFLDPVCTSDCPLIAQEFRQADQALGAKSRGVEMVAIVANPLYLSVSYTRAFDSQERLTGLRNWLFLTGTLPQLQQAWKNYAIAAQILPAGGMIGHSDVAYVIDASGHTRTELNFDPGPGTASSQSSFAAELSDAAQQVMK